MTAENPAMGEVIVNQTTDWLDLPNPAAPYYVFAREGLYLHRQTAQGRGLIPWDKMPTSPKPTGYPQGRFQFTGPMVPASIYAQAVHFFRRTFEKHHTEAEVILTQHIDTKEYRLFIPTQDVSHGAVRSIYNPEHIDRRYLVVGTFHSHCDFGPGHSSTDEGDARDMDGLHGTIGYVNREKPEMALMYALNGKFFHFAMPFDGVVDMSDLDAGRAPEWWDKYLITTKPTDADRNRIAPYASDDEWAKFMGRFKRPVTVTAVTTTQPKPAQKPAPTRSEDWDEAGLSAMGYRFSKELNAYLWVGSEPLNESKQFNAARDLGLRVVDADESETSALWAEQAQQDYWEDMLGKEYIDALFNTGLLTDADLDMAFDNFPKSASTEFWERRMRSKLFASVAWLRHQGYTVTVKVTDPVKPVPGQTTVEDHLTQKGAHL